MLVSFFPCHLEGGGKEETKEFVGKMPTSYNLSLRRRVALSPAAAQPKNQ